MNLDHVFLFTKYTRNHGHVSHLTAIRTDRRGHGVAAFSSGIAPKKEAESSEFPTLDSAIRMMDHELAFGVNPVVIVSTDVVSDRKLYSKAFPFDDCIWLDISQLAWPLVMHTAVSKERTFKELCLHFEINIEKDGNGTAECVALSHLYWAMMTRFKTSLFGEEVIRNAGGKALGHIRKLIGV